MVTSLISILGRIVVSFLGYTSRIKFSPSSGYADLERKKLPYILAFWHRQQLLLVFPFRKKGISVLVSRSRDGEYIARILDKMGFSVVRGSSSNGGHTAFNELVERLRNGRVVAITPDGPRGPERSVHNGVVALAQHTGFPVVPLGVAAKREFYLKSWDRFIVPYPFNRLTIVLGDPIYIKSGTDDDTAKAMITQGLDEVRNRCLSGLIR